MPDRGGGSRRHGGRQCGGKDEAAGKAADEIDQRMASGDIATDDTKGLAQRPLDQGDAVHQPLAFGHAAAARSIHAHGMDLVDVGHRAMLVAHIEDFLDRRDIAIHRIDGFKGHDLGRIGRQTCQLAVQIFGVVVLPDHLLAARVANALDHRGVVELIGQDHRIG